MTYQWTEPSKQDDELYYIHNKSNGRAYIHINGDTDEQAKEIANLIYEALIQ